jgi:hypothetical protein
MPVHIVHVYNMIIYVVTSMVKRTCLLHAYVIMVFQVHACVTIVHDSIGIVKALIVYT